MELAALPLAAAAAGCNALSSVLQRRANRAESPDKSFGPRVLAAVMRRPAWLLGMVAMIASFLLQAAALGIGTLSSVEPVLALELPATLLLATWLLRVRLLRRDALIATAMAAGLALFLGGLGPSGGDAGSVTDLQVATAAALTVGGIVAILAIGRLGPRRSRAAAYGAAAGSGFGLTAALMKVAVTALADQGVVGLLGTWETYATALTGMASIVLVQAALHVGTLVAAQPGFTLMDPVVSVAWGVAVLGEHVRSGIVLVVAFAGAAVVGGAVVLLARSGALVSEDTERGKSQRQRTR